MFGIEQAWGRLRRAVLRRFRSGYVARMRAAQSRTCRECPFDVVDARDLQLIRNVCCCDIDPAADRFAWRDDLPLARRGLAEVMVLGAALVGVGVTLTLWSAWVLPVPAALLVFIFWFFRDPARTSPADDDLVLSAADGRVDDIGEVDYLPALGGPAWRVGVFLSLFDVHLNRAPCRVRVLEIDYRIGAHKATYRVGATDANECMSTVFETAADRLPLVVRQIAGPAARRIVNWARPSQQFEAGERFGLIKFGSRTEVYLPRDPRVELVVRPGSRVRAGITALARLHRAPAG